MARKLFRAIELFCRGDVLDIGGASFYSYVRERRLNISTWTSLDVDKDRLGTSLDTKHNVIAGDGCEMDFKDCSFDAVLNIQVLEHVMEPLKMISEISRVLKPGAHAILLIPQTACIHMIPHCYYNFSIFWIRESLKKNGMDIVEEYNLGGVWSSALFKYIYFFCQAFRVKGFTSKEFKRNYAFYMLIPFMIIYSLISIPIVALFSLGDLCEEPNNHLVVARKV